MIEIVLMLRLISWNLDSMNNKLQKLIEEREDK